VAENPYRLESSGGYYGLIKKGGKQFRRSLKTRDRKLAERRLKGLKVKIVLRVSDEAKCDFKTLAGHWLDSRGHKLAGSTAEWYGYFIKNPGNFFGAASVRNITAQDCERWEATRRKTVGTKSFVTELDTMNAVFKYAARHGLILANPADQSSGQRCASPICTCQVWKSSSIGRVPANPPNNPPIRWTKRRSESVQNRR
jgi:hypothetical protein